MKNVTVHRFSVQVSGLIKLKLYSLNPSNKYGFCHIIANHHIPDLGRDMEAVSFLVKDVDKLAYGVENTTFEPLNLEPLNPKEQ